VAGIDCAPHFPGQNQSLLGRLFDYFTPHFSYYCCPAGTWIPKGMAGNYWARIIG